MSKATQLAPVRMGLCLALALSCLAGVLPATLQAASGERPGRIQFSDGKSGEGAISLAPGVELTLDTGHGLRRISLEKIQSISLAPEHEELVQKWRFLEAGKTQKQMEGDPYPVRQLRATVTLGGGEVLSGHLYTTVLYVEGQEKTQKVVLWAKQRGEEGQSLASLVYPSQIVFRDTPESESDHIRVEAQVPAGKDPAEIVALTHGSLVRLEATPSSQPGQYSLPSGLGADLLLAVKTGPVMAVDWPNSAPEPFPTLVRTNLTLVEDFFDKRELLAVLYDAAQQDVYSLLLLSREGTTTLTAEKNRPWRLVVLRWKYEPDHNRVLLAGRGYFFRGILAPGEPLPSVRLDSKPWQSGRQIRINLLE
jgi:hypothetical protein